MIDQDSSNASRDLPDREVRVLSRAPPGRRPTNVWFIRDLYSEQYAHPPADIVCCRHTLKHIQPTREFMQMVGRMISQRKDPLVYLEAPDMTRVLRERALWDIYYKHLRI
jgi:hypothetical protein